MTGAGWAAGPALDVRHQPPGITVYMYFICVIHHINAASKVVKAAGSYQWSLYQWLFKLHLQFSIQSLLGFVLYRARLLYTFQIHQEYLNYILMHRNAHGMHLKN